eukprot:CAMPEP_0172360078 /NCGR_PEP_ID=MMETSP1060-20121228/4173_1 /TAXON_ID=37318 /ORGANISM="Pseudo-nitzschia pungens, Strain cf. cingulata" /LENGTH=98 /DNA_ID=CAMNT_0013081957 /DNA_START=144 /DNA_END=437 /DNA_ORIENTATION=+
MKALLIHSVILLAASRCGVVFGVESKLGLRGSNLLQDEYLKGLGRELQISSPDNTSSISGELCSFVCAPPPPTIEPTSAPSPQPSEEPSDSPSEEPSE